MAKNDFLDRQRQRDSKFFESGMNFGVQLAHDFYQMALHNKDVMGGRAMGRGTLEKVAAFTSKLDDHFSDAFAGGPEADYLQEEMDGVLRDIYGKDLVPFRERYPMVKQFGYLKSRKGWK